MTTTESYMNERLDHLGIVAGVCQEIGLAAWLDAQDPGNRQQVSVGTATVAMILNGLGFSNRQLYLVPQYFANKPVEPLLGAGMSADMLNDDCLGRTLDWLYAHDPTKLFAGIASQARQAFGITARQVHVDTTSFSVIVRTSASEQGARASLQRQVSGAEASWERKCWHLGAWRFACEADARAALERELKGKPMWLEIDHEIVAHARHAGKGRPRKEDNPTTYQWQIVATVTVDQQRVDEEVLRKACFIVGTNELKSEQLSDQELVTTYKDQGGVERGFRFLRRSVVPGFLGVRQETRAHHRASA